MKNLFIIIIVLLVFNGCSTYRKQVGYEKKSKNHLVEKNENLVYNFGSYDLDNNLTYIYKDTLKISYLIWDKLFQVKIENLTNIPLYINLGLSNFTRNGIPNRYINYVKDVSTNMIPANSYFILADINPALEIDSLNREAGKSIYDEVNNSPQKLKEYIESTSPVIFKNSITFSSDQNFENVRKIDNKFWINNISILRDVTVVNNMHCTYRLNKYSVLETYYYDDPVYKKRIKVDWRVVGKVSLWTGFVGGLVGFVYICILIGNGDL